MSENQATSGQAPPGGPFVVTERAARRISEILESEGGGQPESSESPSPAAVAPASNTASIWIPSDQDGDIAVERDGAVVVIDGMSLLYMMGCEVDFVEDLTGSYFRVNNPNASSSCGCGNSFAI